MFHTFLHLKIQKLNRIYLVCLKRHCCDPFLNDPNKLKTTETHCALAGGLASLACKRCLQMCHTHKCCQVPNAAQRPRLNSSPQIRFHSNLISLLVQRGFFCSRGCGLIPAPARAPAFDQLLSGEGYRQKSSGAGESPQSRAGPASCHCGCWWD